MKTWKCPRCGATLRAIGKEASCIGGVQKPPPAASTAHPRVQMKEVAP